MILARDGKRRERKMPDKKINAVRPFSMKVRCGDCKLEGEVSSDDWPVRITGAVELLCPRCGKKTVYVGTFGHSVDAARQQADLRASGVSPLSEEGSTP